MVDDEDVDGDFLRNELEAELLLQGGEEIGEVGVREAGCGVGELDVVVAGDAGFVDDMATGGNLQQRCETAKIHLPGPEFVLENLAADKFSFRVCGICLLAWLKRVWMQLEASLGDDQGVARDEFLLPMSDQVEAIFQEIMQQRLHLLAREAGVSFNLGGDVVELRVEPTRSA